jgi:hypothetical protein
MAAKAEAKKEALLAAAALASASHITLHQFVQAFKPPHNDAAMQLARREKQEAKQVAAAEATANGGAGCGGGCAGGCNGAAGAAGGSSSSSSSSSSSDRPLTLRKRGGSTAWINDAFGRVMAAIDRDGLLLHEAFFAFDINGENKQEKERLLCRTTSKGR